MIGGIDQQIQQKVDAYRGNPQQLMQRYQQNQELIDLLALQKLKSEKDAAAREMQMQMQGNPQTIKDQREAEMLQRTKDDMVQQTSGIMQQRQQQQQKNMQRTANQGLPQLPAANMQRMAGGGIVAFAEGGPLNQEDVDAQLRQMIDAALELGESPEALAERLKDNPNALAILRSRAQGAQRSEAPDTIVQDKIASMKGKLSPSLGSIDTDKLVRDMGVTPLSEKPPREGGILDFLKPEPRKNQAELDAFRQKGEQSRAAAEARRAEVAKTSPLQGTGPIDLFAGEEDALQEIDMSQIPERMAMPERPAPAAPTATPAPAPATPMATPTPTPQGQGQGQGIASVAPQSARSSYEARRKEYEDLLKAQQDPEKLRKEKLRDFLLGAGGRSSFGSVMAGGTAAAARRQAQQEAAQRSGIEKLMGVDKELMGMDADEAKLEVERQTAEGLRELRNMQAGTQRLQALGTLYNDATEQLQTALMQDPEYQRALEAVAKAEEGGFFGVDEEDIRAARMQLSQALERVTRSMPNYLMLKEAYDKMLRAQGGVGSTTAGEIDTSQFQVRQKS